MEKRCEEAQRAAKLWRLPARAGTVCSVAVWAMGREGRGGATAALAECATLILHAGKTGQPRVVYGTVMNRGRIDNFRQPAAWMCHIR